MLCISKASQLARAIDFILDTFLPRLFDNINRAAMLCNRLQQWYRCDLFPQVIAAEQSAESRQSLFEMMPNLTLQFGSLLHQIASMTRQNLKQVMDRIDWLCNESKPIHRCAKDGVQIVRLDNAFDKLGWDGYDNNDDYNRRNAEQTDQSTTAQRFEAARIA